MPREFSRSHRIEEAIQRILSEALAARVRDPRLAGLTITDVKVSRDLSVARAYYSFLGSDPGDRDPGPALAAAAGFLRSTLASELRMRRVPELRFHPDETLAKGRSLEALIDRAVAKDRDGGTEEPGPNGKPT